MSTFDPRGEKDPTKYGLRSCKSIISLNGIIMAARREKCREIAKETQSIIEAGKYTSSCGEDVVVRESLDLSQQNTLYIPASRQLSSSNVVDFVKSEAAFSVENVSSLDGLRQLLHEGFENVAILNFASARNAGGGFLTGARAQEESLCRSSGLYSCLIGNGKNYYSDNRRIHPNKGVYSDGLIYSPSVPVFRLDSGELVPNPCPLGSFVTIPAVNAGIYRKRADGKSKDEVQSFIRDVMRRRMLKLLEVMKENHHRSIVLGAWGCGAFGNEPEMVARLFHECLNSSAFYNAFDRVMFAILDSTGKKHNLVSFQRRFVDTSID